VEVGQADLAKAIDQSRFGKVRERERPWVLPLICQSGSTLCWIRDLDFHGLRTQALLCSSTNRPQPNRQPKTANRPPPPNQTYEKHSFVSPARRRRFAVMEGAIALAATLLPAIEPVDHVTIVPSSKSPIGRTVLEVGAGTGQG
jgi:hypothetical protein